MRRVMLWLLFIDKHVSNRLRLLSWHILVLGWHKNLLLLMIRLFSKLLHLVNWLLLRISSLRS